MRLCRQRKLVGSTPKDAEESKVDEPVDTDALPPRAETLNFIRLHSPHGDYDLLPGIIFFTERWLTKVGLAHPAMTAEYTKHSWKHTLLSFTAWNCHDIKWYEGDLSLQVAFQRFKDTVDGQASPDVNSYYEVSSSPWLQHNLLSFSERGMHGLHGSLLPMKNCF